MTTPDIESDFKTLLNNEEVGPALEQFIILYSCRRLTCSNEMHDISIAHLDIRLANICYDNSIDKAVFIDLDRSVLPEAPRARESVRKRVWV